MTPPNQSYIYLHKVEFEVDKKTGNPTNNNKFYEMKAKNGMFKATWGREGAENPQSKDYPMSPDWEKKYNEKLKKGYTDITQYKAEIVSNSKGQLISTDSEIIALITHLQKAASVATSANYQVEAKQVTQKQIDDAQININNLSESVSKYFGKTGWNLDMFNRELIKLMIIIPRKMKKVVDHIISQNMTKKEIEERIENEQSLLDSMASQVIAIAASGKPQTTQQQTLLEALGIEMRPATPAEADEAKKMCLTHRHKVSKVFVVTNKQTRTIFENDLKKATNKQTKLFWHGSRSQNWWGVLQKGLLIRPSNAITTGSMFGQGIYGAIDDDKSMGYTDGGRWAGGGKNGKVYMGLFEFRTGNAMIINRHDSSCNNLHKTCLQKGYDSVWAKKGVSLHRDEVVIYKSSQATIKYLVEFSV